MIYFQDIHMNYLLVFSNILTFGVYIVALGVILCYFKLFSYFYALYSLSGISVSVTMDAWTFQKNMENKSVYKYKLFNGNIPVTYKDTMHLLQVDENFRETFIKELSLVPFKAYFFETPPVTSQNINTADFEFVLVNSKALAGINSDAVAFQEHFKQKSAVTSFPNIGGDAILIAPCPLEKQLTCYAHLASFVRDANKFQVHELWKRAAEEMEKRVNVRKDKRTWFSTSGLGISWLHIRLDSRPKYYTYPPYRS